MALTELSITASRLLRLTSTGRLGTITRISFALLPSGSDGKCQIQGILTLDCPLRDLWARLPPHTVHANWPTDRVGSSEVCLSIRELQSLVVESEKLGPSYGSALRGLIFDWITSTQILGTGFGVIGFNMMQFSGESTSTVTWYATSEFKELLQSLTIYPRWSSKRELLGYVMSTYGTSPITHISALPMGPCDAMT